MSHINYHQELLVRAHVLSLTELSEFLSTEQLLAIPNPNLKLIKSVSGMAKTNIKIVIQIFRNREK